MIFAKILFISSVVSCLIKSIFDIHKSFYREKFNEDNSSRQQREKAIFYSLTGAMSPFKKESAIYHLPSYLSGILYHAGSFIGFFWIFLYFFQIHLPGWTVLFSKCIFIFSLASGLILFSKRIINKELRYLSSPDDYFSNILVSGFQALILFSFNSKELLPFVFIYIAILLFYIPLGKLRHSIFFI